LPRMGVSGVPHAQPHAHGAPYGAPPKPPSRVEPFFIERERLFTGGVMEVKNVSYKVGDKVEAWHKVCIL
jgi:hypothetical protein